MNKQINVRVVEDNRASLVEFGKIYGKRIFKASKVPVMTDFNRQQREAEENAGITLSRSPYRYKMEAIDITSIKIGQGVDGATVVILNEGLEDAAGNSTEVRCPIENSKFATKVTEDAVREAIDKHNNDMLFMSGRELASKLSPANMGEIARLKKLIADAESMIKIIESTNDKNVNDTDEYYKQLDGKVRVQVTVAD